MSLPEPSRPGSLLHLLAQLPENAVGKGRQFERICKWFLENDPVYRARLRKVWLWDEWPGRWGPDAGIDMVGEAQDGGLWAIQAKAYADHVRVTKADLDTFLAESARPQFTYRLLIATTERMGDRARKTIRGQAVPVGTVTLGDLIDASVVWPSSLQDLRAIKEPPKEPLPHQRDAVQDLCNGLADAPRGQLIMACGTGKTLTALYVAEALNTKKVLFLVPSLSLLSQVVREWMANTTSPMDFIAVCSDESVVEHDSLVEATSDLGIPVTTSPADITAFLLKKTSSRQVIFSTYQSSPMVAEGQARTTKQAARLDLVVADEAHRLAGDPSAAFATALGDALIADRRLFMTATPKVPSAQVKRAAKEQDVTLASMDDPAIFGPVLHTLSFPDAIAAGLLTDYRVAVVAVDDSEFLEWTQRGLFLRSEGLRKMDARTLASHIGLAKAFREFDIKRAISFHTRVAAAREFSEAHAEVVGWMPSGERASGDLQADYISGEMPASERRRRLDSLRHPTAERALLANARCLTEGIDVPALDGVAFINPRTSEVDIVQAVGRAIRLDPAKRLGTVVIPVFIGSREDPESAIQGSAFKPVWDVLNALRAHDGALAARLDNLRRELGPRARANLELPSKIHFDLPSWVTPEFASAIRAQVVENTTERWQLMLGLLERFVEQEGHARVPSVYEFEGRQLGTWVSHQRQLRSTMTETRRAELERLPGWVWDSKEAAWEDAFALLLRYVKREGTSRVPQSHVEDGFKLGQWVSWRRHTGDSLREDRRRRLGALPGWTWDKLEAEWEEAFGLLLRYVEREGTAEMPASTVEEGFKLGSWVSYQKRMYTAGRLQPSREARLEPLPGWIWNAREAAWEKGFARLQAYVAREGTANVPQHHVEGGFRLGSWVSDQRRRDAGLSTERRDRLEALPGWVWGANREAWDAAFAALRTYAEREGHATVPKDHIESGIKLGYWVAAQRSRRDQLTADRRSRLEALPGWSWNTRDDYWEQGIVLLRQYVEREGVARPPQRHMEDGYPLGRWVYARRRGRLRLAPERRAELEALPGWVWDAGQARWEENYQLLVAFAEREGSALIPQHHAENGVALGLWAKNQRRARARMPKERIQKFEAIAGWTWDYREAAWAEGLRALEKYVAREGHALVPQGHKEDGYPLGSWVGMQRRMRSRMSGDRRSRLEAVSGWVWDVKDAAWQEAYEVLLKFCEREGHANVRTHHVESGFRLGRWVSNQRSLRRQLSPARRRLLEELPGWAWARPREK